jgi:hypothetical protein
MEVLEYNCMGSFVVVETIIYNIKDIKTDRRAKKNCASEVLPVDMLTTGYPFENVKGPHSLES